MEEHEEEYFFVDLYLEKAKSDKSKCRKCIKNISKDTYRWCSI